MMQDVYEISQLACHRLDQIGHCKNFVEVKIHEDEFTLLQRAHEKQIDDKQAGKVWHHLQISLGNTFRYTLVSGVCSILEDSVTGIAKIILGDDAAYKKGNRSPLTDWRSCQTGNLLSSLACQIRRVQDVVNSNAEFRSWKLRSANYSRS